MHYYKTMGGFNPINLIINTAQFLRAQNTQSQPNNTGDSVKNMPNNVFINYNTGLTPKPLSASNQTVISTVEIEQRANYIKDLLNLPRDFETLINQIQSGQTTFGAKEFSRLLQNGKININALSLMLSENSKEAVQKLMMTIISVSKMGSNNVAQLKELMGLLSGGNNIDNSQTVKNVLMLYLPWLPLSVRNDLNLDFDIDIFDKIQGPNPDENENPEMIKIMIQTANYGNVMAELELAQNNEINVFISAEENFPEKEVLELFKKENKKTNVRSNITIEKNNYKNEQNSQDVQITASKYVSPKLLFSAHSLIKIIIDIDSSNFIINEEEG